MSPTLWTTLAVAALGARKNPTLPEIPMRTIRIATLVGLLAGALCGTGQAQAAQSEARVTPPTAAAAESSAADVSSADVAAAPADSTPADSMPVKKGGGLFGKVKRVAKNKVVQQVAKTAACTMLPGGQIVASAIDAAGDKSAVGAAAGAATGTSCMPGMGGAGGAAAAAAMGGGALPGAIVPGAAMDAAALAAYQAQMMAMMPPSQGQMGPMPGGPGTVPGAAMPEGSGQPLEVASDLAAQLRKGKTAVRHIGWVAGGVGLTEQGTTAFTAAAADIVAAMRAAGGRYRLDLYMDKTYQDAAAKMLGPQRLSTVQTMLVHASGGDVSAAPQIGKVKRDGDPRLEIVKVD